MKAAEAGGTEVEVLGGLAQLGEHLLCKQGVVGSIPSTSTIHPAASHHTGPVKTKRESASQ